MSAAGDNGEETVPALGTEAVVAPAPPKKRDFAPDDEKGVLVTNVRDALRALPGYFTSETIIEGVEAGDLFSLNSVLANAIEIQVVQALNKIRSVWDPEDTWQAYRFERRSQSFPDVRLIARREDGVVDTAMGIELKGWYLLSREREPSFRYKITADACSPYDLIAIVPWYLKNVLSGSPVVLEPLIESAHHAAEYRNFYWESIRDTARAKGVNKPPGPVTPYPESKTRVNDAAVFDESDNFGRIARISELADVYTKAALTERIAGIEARSWITFFKTHTDASDSEAVWGALEKRRRSGLRKGSEFAAERLQTLLDEVAGIVRGERRGG
jgi:hypothetical protein